MAAQNGTFLLFYSMDIGGTNGTAEEGYAYWTGDYGWVSPSYFMGGPPTEFPFPFFPFQAVINLKTGELMAADDDSSSLDGNGIIELVTQANQ